MSGRFVFEKNDHHPIRLGRHQGRFVALKVLCIKQLLKVCRVNALNDSIAWAQFPDALWKIRAHGLIGCARRAA